MIQTPLKMSQSGYWSGIPRQFGSIQKLRIEILFMKMIFLIYKFFQQNVFMSYCYQFLECTVEKTEKFGHFFLFY